MGMVGWRALRTLVSRPLGIPTVKLAMDRPLTFEPTNDLHNKALWVISAYKLAMDRPLTFEPTNDLHNKALWVIAAYSLAHSGSSIERAACLLLLSI